MKICELLQIGKKILNNSEEPKIILSSLLNKSIEWLIINSEILLEDKELIKNFFKFLLLKKNGVPIEYLTGKKEFFSETIEINRNVLIPRNETEKLLEVAIYLIKKEKIKKIIDIGTGSGIIPLVIKKNFPDLEIIATDINIDTLFVAKKNLKNLNVNLILCNILDAIKGKFDLIISNPPYVKTNHINILPESVKKYEPKIAINGGKDGLRFYKEIITKSRSILNRNGLIIFEIGYFSHVEILKKMLLNNNFYEIEIFRDNLNFPRVIKAKWKEENF